jgi:4a-hydroxytetrahydrobiopterin dehydratase
VSRTLGDEHCVSGAKRLADADVAAQLAALPGWMRDGDSLTRTFRFPDYHATIAFVNAVAFIAQREDHHPDLSVHYNRCVVTWSTHDAGGITRNDLICAARVSRLGD